MRSRALAPAPSSVAFRSPTPAALHFLRGKDADGRLRELSAARAAARPVLGALASAFLDARAHEKLAFRSLSDYARAKLGVDARSVREWARVWRALQKLPELRGAVVAGEVGWTVARLVVGMVTPQTDRACLETVRGRTVRAMKAILEAVHEADPRSPGPAEEDEDDVEYTSVRLPCDAREAGLWTAALELARRVAGEPLPVWRCAEKLSAEAASAIGAPDLAGTAPESGSRSARRARSAPEESGLREVAFPRLRWRSRALPVPPELAQLVDGLEGCDARERGRRLRAAVAFLQRLDFETGRVLRQVKDRRLFAELGFEGKAEGRAASRRRAKLDGFNRYCAERLDLAPRTARRLVALSRAEHRAPALATAFRRGGLHAGQAAVLLRVADLESAERWVKRAKQVTLRRLEDDVDAAAPVPRAIAFRAPPDVAAFFLAMVARAGSLERLLAHAIRTWVEVGKCFDDYADFERDGFRCTAPDCTCRCNLQSHHIEFLSQQGPDVPWNRTTLCPQHHLRAVHRERTLVIRGRAPDGLVLELGGPGGERFRSGDVRV